MSETPDKLRDLILSERDKGNIVFRGLPDQLMTAPLDEFIEQPAEGMLYDLNRLEEISLTFLKDPKWVNDFAVALVIRKLTARLRQAEADLVKAREDAERYRWLRSSDNAIPLMADKGERRFPSSELDAAIDRAMKGKPT